MLTEAMKIALMFIMNNHMYKYIKIKLQSKGGSIGLELTGVLAQLFMIWWDGQFLRKMEENGLRLSMYRRFVDDIDVIINGAKAGLRYVEGKVTKDGNVIELGQDVEADKRSMLLVQSIGNSIHPPIEIQVD